MVFVLRMTHALCGSVQTLREIKVNLRTLKKRNADFCKNYKMKRIVGRVVAGYFRMVRESETVPVGRRGVV